MILYIQIQYSCVQYNAHNTFYCNIEYNAVQYNLVQIILILEYNRVSFDIVDGWITNTTMILYGGKHKIM